jgi:phosphate transport system protein
MTQIRHVDVEMAELKRSLVGMAELVELMLDLALATLRQPAIEAREQARGIEAKLDDLDTVIVERCHLIIALHAPVARDLRFLISATRITSGLEQIGDLVEGVVKRAHYIARHSPVANPPQLEELGRTAQRMIRDAMEAFVGGATEGAKRVMADEDRADALTKQAYRSLQQAMMSDRERVPEYTHLFRAVIGLEQSADAAVAIAEEAVYIHTGQLVRHRHDEIPG